VDFNRTVESPDFSFPIKFLIIANGMKIQLKTAAAVFAGFGIGVVAIHGLQGGQAKPPPAFVISNNCGFNSALFDRSADSRILENSVVVVYGGLDVVRESRRGKDLILCNSKALKESSHHRS
jgi:hypothetical protein